MVNRTAVGSLARKEVPASRRSAQPRSSSPLRRFEDSDRQTVMLRLILEACQKYALKACSISLFSSADNDSNNGVESSLMLAKGSSTSVGLKTTGIRARKYSPRITN